jgi:hypothetical protein
VEEVQVVNARGEEVGDEDLDDLSRTIDQPIQREGQDRDTVDYMRRRGASRCRRILTYDRR